VVRLKSRRFFRWTLPLFAAFAVFAIILLSWYYYRSASIWYRETRQERVLTETLAGIKRFNKELRREVASLETTEGIKDYARRELNLVDRGDHSIVVTRDGVPLKAEKNTREAAVAAIPEQARPFGNWTDFLDSFFGIEK
jgi:cell division protein FtsB